MTAPHPIRAIISAVALSAVMTLTACGGGPSQTSANTTSPSASATTHRIATTSATVQIPSDWSQTTTGDVFVATSPNAGGKPRFTPTVSIAVGPGNGDLEATGQAARTTVADFTDWTEDTDQQGVSSNGPTPAYLISGTYQGDQGLTVHQESAIMAVTASEKTTYVTVTCSYATGDETGAAQTRSVLASFNAGG